MHKYLDRYVNVRSVLDFFTSVAVCHGEYNANSALDTIFELRDILPFTRVSIAVAVHGVL